MVAVRPVYLVHSDGSSFATYVFVDSETGTTVVPVFLWCFPASVNREAVAGMGGIRVAVPEDLPTMAAAMV